MPAENFSARLQKGAAVHRRLLVVLAAVAIPSCGGQTSPTSTSSAGGADAGGATNAGGSSAGSGGSSAGNGGAAASAGQGGDGGVGGPGDGGTGGSGDGGTGGDGGTNAGSGGDAGTGGMMSECGPGKIPKCVRDCSLDAQCAQYAPFNKGYDCNSGCIGIGQGHVCCSE